MTLIEIGLAVWAIVVGALVSALIGLRLYVAWAKWELIRRRIVRQWSKDDQSFLERAIDRTAKRNAKKGTRNE